MPILARPDVRLHYEVDGAGPPLLLIAGMCSDGASWLPLLPWLTPHFTVIRPDNRTTGRTAPWDAPASVPIFAADCAALLDHLGHARAHVLGHSMGGLIALELAAARPGLVATATLLAAAPLRLARNVALFEALLAIRDAGGPPDLWLRAFFPWLFASEAFETPGAIDAAVAAALAYPFAQGAAAMRHQLAALAGHVPAAPAKGVAMQAVLGEGDLLIPETAARAALGEMPVHVLPRAGHSVHWDAPVEVAVRLRAFAEARPL